MNFFWIVILVVFAGLQGYEIVSKTEEEINNKSVKRSRHRLYMIAILCSISLLSGVMKYIVFLVYGAFLSMIGVYIMVQKHGRSKETIIKAVFQSVLILLFFSAIILLCVKLNMK